MLKLSSDVRRLIKKPWIWVAVIFASAAVWLLGFYWASQTPLTYTFRVWVGEAGGFTEELTAQIREECYSAGMKKCAVNAYNPEDYHYGAAFALQANNVDIYVLSRDEALVTAETGIFLPLESYSADDNVLEYDGKIIGVNFTDNYYVFINGASRKDKNLLYNVVGIIVRYGERL